MKLKRTLEPSFNPDILKVTAIVKEGRANSCEKKRRSKHALSFAVHLQRQVNL
jgi:hypothetical protein